MRIGLRARMAIVMAVVVLLVAATLVSLSLWAGARQVAASEAANQENAAAAIAETVELHLAGAAQILFGAAQILASGVPEGPEDEGAILLDSLVASRHQFLTVHILDGRDVVLSRPPSANVPTAALDAPAGDEPLWDGELLFLVAPVAGNETCCRLVGALSLERIEELLLSGIQGLPAGSEGVVLAGDGTVLAQTPEWPLVLVELGAEGVPEDGVRHGYSVRSSDNATYNVVIAAPRSATAALVGGLVRTAIPPSILLAGVGLLIGVAVAHRVLVPLDDLRSTSRRMRHGDLGARAPYHGAPELQELAGDFNQMAASLEKDRRRLITLQRHLEDLVKERTAELEDKQQEMEQFFYGVSHDMKSPILTISNYVRLAADRLEQGQREGVEECLRYVGDAGKRLGDLIDELLLFAQVPEAAPRNEEVRVADLVQDVVATLRQQADDKGVRVVVQGDGMTVRSDAGRLRHIMENLVDNAVRYMTGGGEVRVSWWPGGAVGPPDPPPPPPAPAPSTGSDAVARDPSTGSHAGDARAGPDQTPPGTGWTLVVEDDGTGLPTEILDHLFQPFAQHARRGGHKGGSGLGLSIVKRMTDSLGGRIELSTSSTGTRFRIHFPEDAS